MKKIYVLLIALLCAITMLPAAITDFYTAPVASSGTYTAVVGGTSAAISGDDALSAALPIGFTFNYCGADYTTFKMDTNGYINLGGNLTSYNYSNNMASTTIRPIITGVWDDMSSPAGACVYLTTGTAPNRVLTAQWTNISWNYGGTAGQNFQIQLFETTKQIKINIGAMVAPSSPSASIGINVAPGGSGNFYSITPGSPMTSSSTTSNNSINAITYLTSGTTYTFDAVATGVAPNPATLVGPANGATGVSRLTSLSWSSGGGGLATGYRVFFGTNNPPTNIVNGTTQSGTVYTPAAALDPTMTYYWKIVPYNGVGDASGSVVWSFTTGSELPVTWIARLRDSYGDGWNGGLLNVMLNGVNVVTGAAIGTGFGPEDYPFFVMNNDALTTSYTAGSWSYENSYEIIDHNGAVVFASTVGSTPTSITTPIICQTIATIPNPATLVAPADAATGLPVAVDLDWANGGAGPTGYYLSFGIDNPPTSLLDMSDQGTNTLYSASGLTANTTYYWMVTPYNAVGNATGCPVWSFTTYSNVPNVATLVAPLDAAVSQPTTLDLDWTDGGGTTQGYYLHVGTNNPPSNMVSMLDLGATSIYNLTGLANGTTYYWQVIPYNPNGNAVACPVWSFTTYADPPAAAVMVAPANGATGIDPYTAILDWSAPLTGGVVEDYAVGLALTDVTEDLFAAAYATVAPVTQFTPYVDASFLMNFNTWYYWQIYPTNAFGAPDLADCPIYSFKTKAQMQVASNSLPLGTVLPGATVTGTIPVQNLGTTDLTFTASGTDFTFGPSFTITAGTTYDLPYSFTAPGTENLTYTSTITLTETSPSNSSLTINVTASVNDPTVAIPYAESFTAATWPTDWTQMYSGGVTSNRWSVTATVYSGGVANEMHNGWTSGVGISRLISPALATTGLSNISVAFRHFYDDYGTGLSYKLQTSPDGTNWTDTAWSFTSGAGNAGPVLVNLVVPAAGALTYLAWTIDGDHYQYDNWYVDDVSVGLPPSHDVGVTAVNISGVVTPDAFAPTATVVNNGGVAETFNVSLAITGGYSSIQTVTGLAAGSSTTVTFDAFTPVANTSYTATVTTTLGTDATPANDTMSKSFVCIFLNVDAYAYNANGVGTVQGPVAFNLQTPGTLNSLAATTSSNFLSGGDWANGTWYGVQYYDGATYLNDYFWTINPYNGVMTQIGATGGVALHGLAFNPNTNVMFGAGIDALYSVNLTTGAATLIGSYGGPAGMIGIACDHANNVLYGVDLYTDQLYTINQTTGAATVVGPLGIDLNYAQDAAFDQAHGSLFLSAYTTTGSLYWVDKTVGTAYLVGGFTGGAEVDCFAIPYTSAGITAPVVTMVGGDITWTAVAGATHYTVYGSSDPYGTFDFITNLGPEYTSWPINTEVGYPAAQRFYQVTANNSGALAPAGEVFNGLHQTAATVRTAVKTVNAVSTPASTDINRNEKIKK